METKLREVQALVQESWQRFEHKPQDSSLIPPVKKVTATENANSSKDKPLGSLEPSKPSMNSAAAQELASEVQQYLEEVQIQLNFKVQEETGDLVVQIVNQQTGDVVRQIPPEQLLNLREKLEELRGVLFHGKV